MKKTLAAVLCSTVLALSCPFFVPLTAHADSTDTEIIGTYGSKTYMGTYDSWDDRHWDPDDFTDVTGEDVDCSGPLIVRSGTIGNVSLSGNCSDLTIEGGNIAGRGM